METKAILKKLSYGLWAIGGILLILIIVSWFIEYPKWLDHLITNILLIGLGIVMQYKAWQIRNSDRKFASVYLIIALALIAVALVSFTFVKIMAVVGLAVFLLTNRRVQAVINKK